MTPTERQQWILNKMREHPGSPIDILDAEFVVAYCEATGAKATPMFVGAPKCPQLGRDLGELYKRELLRREPVGLPSGDSSMGFPKWVYSYQL